MIRNTITEILSGTQWRAENDAVLFVDVIIYNFVALVRAETLQIPLDRWKRGVKSLLLSYIIDANFAEVWRS